METREVIIKNKLGIHCRPSSVIINKAMEYKDCKFKIITDKGSIDLTSILDLISLGLQKGDRVVVEVEGEREGEACKYIASLFEREFDFN